MDALILKYLQGNLSFQGQIELSKWLQSDPKNEEIFNKLIVYWFYHKENLGKEDQEIRSRIHALMQEERNSQDHKSHSRPLKAVYWVAASVLLVVSIVSGIYYHELSAKESSQQLVSRLIEKVCLPGQKIITELPDGTRVKLNADSKLVAPAQFEGESREVTLTGEAFFEVVPDPTKPFLIHTNDLTIRVLGTSFNVRSYEGEANTQVSVKMGKVSVKSTRTSQEVKLEPSEQAVFHMEDQYLSKERILEPLDVFGWTEQYLVLADQNMDEIMQILSRWYGKEFVVQVELDNHKKFTGKYKNPSLKSVMESLSYAYDFNYRLNEQNVIIN